MCIVYAKILRTMYDRYFIKDWDGNKSWIPKSEVKAKKRYGIKNGYYALTVSDEFAKKKGLIADVG